MYLDESTEAPPAERIEHFDHDVVVIGGCGRAGLPLALAFADRGIKVAIFDIDGTAVSRLTEGLMPFKEEGGQEALDRVLKEGRLVATTDPAVISRSECLIVLIGTPVDEYMNPDLQAVPKAVGMISQHLRHGQLLVLRSTVYPGVTALVEELVGQLGLHIDVAFCPERIAEGKALTELYELPQIVSGRTAAALDRSKKLFSNLTAHNLELEPEEAELAKLFTNTWRYTKFAVANQLYMIANDYGLDFEKIRSVMTYRYPRAADIPGAGFAAGPCLFKDTMQLAAFNNNNFVLGQASIMVNEGLPLYMVAKLEQQYKLHDMTVGILGMAFKAESDDIRSSLSYKLKKLLKFKTREVLCTDHYVSNDPGLVPLEEVLERADLLIVGAPHKIYASIRADVPIVDIWNLFQKGVKV
ncbi:MAG: nucleotide sugar dehydrogenase [Actinomycetota bacterium]